MQIIWLSFCIHTQREQRADRLIRLLLVSGEYDLIWLCNFVVPCTARAYLYVWHSTGERTNISGAPVFGFDRSLTFSPLFPGCVASVCFSSPKALCCHPSKAHSCCLGGGQLGLPYVQNRLFLLLSSACGRWQGLSSSGSWFLLGLCFLLLNSQKSILLIKHVNSL